MKQSSENAADALQEIDPLVAEICSDLQDPRMIRAVVERAAGRTWEEVADKCRVNVNTLLRWRWEHPIDTYASRVAAVAFGEGVLVLRAGFSASARALVEAADGRLEMSPVRLGAAKAVVGTALKVAMAEAGLLGGSTTLDKPKRSAADLPDAELRSAVRHVAKMRKGK